MKKLLFSIFAALTLTAPAQADSFGVHVGYPFSVGAQYTLGDPSATSGAFRVRLSLLFGGAFGLEAQLDSIFARYSLNEDDSFGVYYGLGGNIGYATASSGKVSATAIVLGAQGTGGIDYAFAPNLAVFLEGSLGYSYGILIASNGSSGFALPVGGTYYRIGTGLNVKF
jgi:hypothetical protein